jgi:hypothetical protein
VSVVQRIGHLSTQRKRALEWQASILLETVAAADS